MLNLQRKKLRQLKVESENLIVPLSWKVGLRLVEAETIWTLETASSAFLLSPPSSRLSSSSDAEGARLRSSQDVCSNFIGFPRRLGPLSTSSSSSLKSVVVLTSTSGNVALFSLPPSFPAIRGSRDEADKTKNETIKNKMNLFMLLPRRDQKFFYL